MNMKTLIVLSVLLNLAIQVWPQDDFKVIFDEETVPVKKDMVFSKENTSVSIDTIRTLIIEKARSYIGVGYHYGQSNEKGFDCSGYVRFVYAGFGFELPHSSYDQYKKSRHIKARKAQPGDLVFFNTSGNSISHVGIYLGDDLFIHSPSSGKTVSIDSLETAYYKKHLVGFGTFLQ
jgi:cell wall-associated NlpC family hydrolase